MNHSRPVPKPSNMGTLGSASIMRIWSSGSMGDGPAVLGPTSEPKEVKSGVGVAFQRSTGMMKGCSTSAVAVGVGSWEEIGCFWGIGTGGGLTAGGYFDWTASARAFACCKSRNRMGCMYA